ncbi:hypothetical protein Maes01_01604 [Microbulbifer aestuariivivens]|uniref:Sulfotransferase domain-containing protein n=2 Tax=Microbulbifer aestuariivivens TaxID=1908308 RepID=A0ABP9WPI5_9GAMM
MRCWFEAPSQWPDSGVLLASFPKSGNSWFRFIVSNIAALTEGNPPVNFRTIEHYSPVIRGNRNLAGARQVIGLPIFLKTHFPRTRFFKNRKAVVVVRNPFFAVPSYYEYLRNAREKKVPRLDSFIYHWRYGIPAWAAFMESWDSAETIVVRYEDLKVDPLTVITKVYQSLGIFVPDRIVNEAIENSSRKSMKSSLEINGDPHNDNNFRFIKEEGENVGVEHLKRSILTSKQIDTSCITLLEKFGYL